MDLLFGDTGVVEIDTSLLDFAGGQVAVLDGLDNIVLISRFAEVGEVVGGTSVYRCVKSLTNHNSPPISLSSERNISSNTRSNK
jgi:hypothetical protein